MQQGSRNERLAFTLIELLVVIAIVALLVSILLPALAAARGTARKAKCQSNLRQMGIAMSSYASDVDGKIATYTWTPSATNSSRYPDLAHAAHPREAVLNQAIALIREQTGRSEFMPSRRVIEEPEPKFTHLVLSEYLSGSVIEPIAACPSDRTLLGWQKNPLDVSPTPTGEDATENMWPYSSTYQVVPASWMRDFTARGSAWWIYQNPADHNRLIGKTGRMQRQLTDVLFPAMKVYMYEFHDRHSGGPGIFHAYKKARSTLVFFDGSVRSPRTSEANVGFHPQHVGDMTPTYYNYAPRILRFEPPTMSGRTTDLVAGYYRWTRGGLRGVDFGGGEVDTGQN